MAAEKRFGLGLCKLSTLLLAKEIGADLVILDDFGVRKLAQREGFRVQGTYGDFGSPFPQRLPYRSSSSVHAIVETWRLFESQCAQTARSNR